ncbi:MAG TPA: CGNR zinc finger domain-containing protein [Candidatus Limnocylindrales bacterium]|jgi:predicted RNA-binding Zn ribbon-like protein
MTTLPTTSDPHAVPHGHQASLETGLAFINTLELEKGSPVDHIETPTDALEWLIAHDLMHRDAELSLADRVAADPAYGEKLIARVRRTRSAMRELVDASVERRPVGASCLDEVNRALRTHYTTILVPSTDGVHMGHRHEGDPVDGALARLAESVARYLGEGKTERLRVCADETCQWAFFDTSRTAKRKWCDMSTCGNRAKAARHRERQRSTLAEAVPTLGTVAQA